MPDIDWKRIKAEYIRGDVSYRKLADLYGVSSSTLYRKMRKEKWADLRKQSQSKTNAKLVESAADKNAKQADMFDTITDKLLAIIDEGLRSGELLTTAKGLRDITGAIKDIREIKGIKSEADMQEQMARIEKLRKEASADAHTDTEYRVVIEGDLDKYTN